ncbi:N-acetyltransferase [Nocardia cyriacigeorgica]|uniref:GNAT family N-acetyltransferase n=1 Tax=Nocardia cyriacigeorgica TaxID=135487 RepID=UPI001895146D|nr:GNAT family N-acetyltransferase [Nocardia cyriacigeorgica]MBF6099070.1 N-acetyltransferase [Nocardia cyriacigeorgica]MBF6159375.1 N-acetyltransferase [Nocardia cyriacigeorgica]MBF6198458.1 N-acetyltransferase [Nocardia cyriacigeorgica]MBF6514912.1 N-acetyltransferase [Nocardia cyriacigeorgica]
MSTEVRNNTALERFEIYVDGAIAGYAEYQDTNAERAFVHTEIYPQYEGQGYGRMLVETALNQTRADHLGALPMCPMVRHFVETRPEYLPMVPHWARGRLGLPQ